MKKLLWVMAILGTCLGLVAEALAVPLLLEENFSYTAGTLLTANGWTNHSGSTNLIPVSTPGLSYSGYASSGIGNAASLTTSGEDVNRTFTNQTSGSVYYAFLVSVSSAGAADYFTHFGSNPFSSYNGFHGRVYCRSASGGVNFGISRAGNASPVWSSTVFALNTTHLIVVKYTFVPGATNDTVDLWVNPTSCPGEPTPQVSAASETTGDYAGLGAIALRQGTSTPTQKIDGLRVGTTWADVVCAAAPTGACCAADGNCSVLTQVACIAAGKVYQGNDTSCSPNPCPQPGTCCFGTTCTFVLQEDCTATWTEGGACSPNPCTEPIGSCCALDGTCTATTQADCTATWTLAGVCEPNTCAQPTGSCCGSDGTCAVTLLVDCTIDWTMFGVCSPNPCPVLTGACCLPGDVCTLGSAAACAAAGGLYEGNYTTCSPNPCALPPSNGRLKIVHLDVGQGDGAVIISPYGQVVLFDTGKAGTGVMGVSVLAQLQALGVTHVDHHFQSHYHADHLANIDEIVNGGIAIDRGWDRGTAHQPSTIVYNTYVSTLGTHRRTMVTNQVVTLDSLSAHPVTIKCVTPNGGGLSTSDENDMSMVLKVTYGEFDMVLGGDLPGTSPAAEATVAPLVGPVEVYKVHHHGSALASTSAWLNATQPQVAVISVGVNGYGHPTATALTNLHNASVRTYWTETGDGVAPNPTWDKVSNGQVIISATWQAAGVDTIRGNGFADTFINSGTPGDITDPVVTVHAPNGGETWSVSSVHDITWTATDNIGVTTIDLAYSTNHGANWTPIVNGEANDGTYAWTIPDAPSTQVLVRVTAHDAASNTGSDASDANLEIDNPAVVTDVLLGPGELLRVYPNPAYAGAAQILYRIPPATAVDLGIYDVTGHLVRRIAAGAPSGGVRTVTWDGQDEGGKPASAGIYLVRLVAGSGIHQTKRLVLFR
jgi:beta-lactamase superfamily II metal-dependent hydrolase